MQARQHSTLVTRAAAQFSREYRRVFGRPPLRDIKALRFVCLTVIRRKQRPRGGTRSYTTQFDCQFTAFPREVRGSLGPNFNHIIFVSTHEVVGVEGIC
jgi:hypothetical protein